MLLPEAPLCATLPGYPALSGLFTHGLLLPPQPLRRLLLTIFPAKLTSTKGSTKFFLLLSKPKICLTLSITASSTGEETHLSPLAHASAIPSVPMIYGSLPVGSTLLNQLSYVSAHLLSLQPPSHITSFIVSPQTPPAPATPVSPGSIRTTKVTGCGPS